MQIGIDGRSLKTSRAIFRYTKNLLNELSRIDTNNEYYLFIEGNQELKDLENLKLKLNWKLVKAPNKLVIKDHFYFYSFLANYRLDLFFHPDNTEFLNCHPRSVVTVHDLIPYLLPEQSLSENPWTRMRQKVYLSLQKKALLRSAFSIITVSQNSQTDLIKFLGLPPDKISVTPEAAESSYKPESAEKIARVKEKYAVNGSYIFCHSGYSRYKNVVKLVEAFPQVLKIFPDLMLVLGGAIPSGRLAGKSYYRRVLQTVKSLGLAGKVIFTGFVEEDLLPSLFSGAKVFACPSLYEGFGLPVLEAQACGAPVLCSNRASLPEVAGAAALYFDPENVSEMAEKMIGLLKDTDSRQDLVRRGFENAKQYSWARCARETLAVFERVAGRR